MIPAFKRLNPEETELMLQAPALVTILIAGADENIDPEETGWAAKVAKYRKATAELPALREYYRAIEGRFVETIEKLIQELPAGLHARTAEIAAQLQGLNAIWPKLSPEFARAFYRDLKTLAEHVAKASGGLLGLGKISDKEREWLDLQMIQPPA